jgi:hypothetical protein
VPVHLDDCAVDQGVFEIGVLRQRFENPFEGTVERPSAEALPNREPLAERLWQIAPRRTGTHDPQHRFDKQPVVLPGPARVALLAGHQRRDAFPLPIGQQ